MKRLTSNEIDARALEAYDKGYQAGRKQLLDQVEKEVIELTFFLGADINGDSEWAVKKMRYLQRQKLSAIRLEVKSKE